MESACLELIYWDAAGEKKSPNNTTDYSQLLLGAFRGSCCDGKRGYGKSHPTPCPAPSRLCAAGGTVRALPRRFPLSLRPRLSPPQRSGEAGSLPVGFGFSLRGCREQRGQALSPYSVFLGIHSQGILEMCPTVPTWAGALWSGWESMGDSQGQNPVRVAPSPAPSWVLLRSNSPNPLQILG